jgi:flagellar biosynthesis/type III secretory pathway M-ring protein FliF/YscJ
MADDKAVFNYEVGDKVRHAKWGVGTVLQVIGHSEKMKLTVMFQEVGQKLLMVKFAGLEKVEAGSGRREKAAEPFVMPAADDEFEPIEAAVTPAAETEEVEADDIEIEDISIEESDDSEEEDDDTL